MGQVSSSSIFSSTFRAEAWGSTFFELTLPSLVRFPKEAEGVSATSDSLRLSTRFCDGLSSDAEDVRNLIQIG